MKEIFADSFDIPNRFASGNWGGLSVIENKVYFAVCKHKIDEQADLFVFDSNTFCLKELTKYPEIFADEKHCVAHGKIHTPFRQYNRKAFFGTHLGYYQKDLKGYSPYKGGRLLSIDIDTEEIEDWGTPIPDEGIISLEIDIRRGIIYVMTWPGAYLLEYNIAKNEWYKIGKYNIFDRTDNVCRSLICSRNGSLFFCTVDGSVHFWDPVLRKVNLIHDNLLNVVFEAAQRYNWNQDKWNVDQLSADKFLSNLKKDGPLFTQMWHPALWDEQNDSIIAIIHFAGVIIRIDPDNMRIKFSGQLCIDSERGQVPTSGTSLTLCCGENNRLYNIGFAPFLEGQTTKIRIHLLSYNTCTQEVNDYGAIKLKNGRNVLYSNTLGTTNNGKLVSLAWVELPESDLDTFFQSKPGKIDVGITAEANPYEIKFLIMNQPN